MIASEVRASWIAMMTTREGGDTEIERPSRRPIVDIETNSPAKRSWREAAENGDRAVDDDPIGGGAAFAMFQLEPTVGRARSEAAPPLDVGRRSTPPTN